MPCCKSLYSAALKGCTKCITQILDATNKRTINLEARQRDRWTPLAAAVIHGDRNTIRTLLNAGSDPFACGSKGNAFDAALKSKSIEPLETLLDRKRPPQEWLDKKALLCMEKNRHTHARCLLQHGAVDIDGNIAAGCAAHVGLVDLLETALLSNPQNNVTLAMSPVARGYASRYGMGFCPNDVSLFELTLINGHLEYARVIHRHMQRNNFQNDLDKLIQALPFWAKWIDCNEEAAKLTVHSGGLRGSPNNAFRMIIPCCNKVYDTKGSGWIGFFFAKKYGNDITGDFSLARRPVRYDNAITESERLIIFASRVFTKCKIDTSVRSYKDTILIDLATLCYTELPERSLQLDFTDIENKSEYFIHPFATARWNRKMFNVNWSYLMIAWIYESGVTFENLDLLMMLRPTELPLFLWNAILLYSLDWKLFITRTMDYGNIILNSNDDKVQWKPRGSRKV